MQLDKPMPRELLAFTPRGLVRALGRGLVSEVSFEGVALFADMSGYTSLAEELCRRGSKGREALSGIIDQAFALHVDCVHAAGGEIASFSGDSILAYWRANRGERARAISAAKSCARALHQSTERRLDKAVFLPRLHIGVAAGRLWAAQLGGHDGVWYRILGGRAATRAFDGAAKAEPGETIELSMAVDDDAPDMAEAPWIFASPTEETLTEDDFGLVPRVVREWWADERRQWLPQVRMVCALFAKIDRLAEAKSLADHQAMIAALQRAIRPYTASAGTLTAEDKGLVFRLYFGTPHNTYRHDAIQALRAGLALGRALEAHGLVCHCGIASGEGICMPIGGRDRLDYMPIGRFAHLAARLMEAPETGVLCTREVAQQAGEEIRLIALSPLRLKGLPDALDVYQAHEAVVANRADPPLRGRAAELALIDYQIDQLRTGHGHILYISGDAGIGKTALANVVIDKAKADGLTVLVGRSTTSELVIPFKIWRSIFAQLLELDLDAETARIASPAIMARLARLPEEYGQLVPLLIAVFPDFAAPEAAKVSLSSEARVDATLTFLAALFRYLVPPAFVLILEDCHWMDSASWQLLLRLTTTSPGLLVVLTSRPQPDPPPLTTIRALPRFRELPLQPLDEITIRQLIADLVPADVEAAEGSEWINQAIDFSMGNPLFAKEYAYLVSAQCRTAASQSWRAVKSQMPTSWTLRGLITSRLDSLRPQILIVLKAASVFGSRFQLALLRHVAPATLRLEDLEEILVDLARHHVVQTIDRVAQTYRFQHDLICEVVYRQLTQPQRQELHDRAAHAIEVVHQGHLEPQYALLADHWSKADNAPKTMHYAELAATQALRSGGYVEAKQFLQLCFDQISRRSGVNVADLRQVRWYRLSADAQFGLGNLPARGRDAYNALRLSGERPPRTHFGMVAGSLIKLVFWASRRLAMSRAHPAGRDPELALELARLYRHSAAVAWFSNDPLAMTASGIDALCHAEAAAPSEVLAGTLVEFGGILGLLGLRRRGRAIMRRAGTIAEQVGDPATLAYVHLLTCLYEVGTGNWAVTDDHALRCERLCEQIGDRVNWCNVQAVRFWSPYYQGALDRAEALAMRMGERTQVDDNGQHRAWALRYAALCDLRRQRPAAAVPLLEDALRALGNITASNETLPVFGLLALARYRSGDRAGARQAALEGLRIMASVSMPTGHAMLEGYAALTDVAFHALLSEPSSPTWRSALDQALYGLRRYQRVFPIGVPRYRLWRGLERALAGRFLASRIHLRRAAASAERLGMSWEQKQAMMALEIGPETFLAELRRQKAAVGMSTKEPA